jgi:glycosyltransferase involved in cell wall biosynthesis
MTNQKKIAVLCNYQLLPERVGGMDYFFWMFEHKCKENNIQVDWFFPNEASHGEYKNLHIKASDNKSIEQFFIENLKENNTAYTHIITHFMELCTPFFKELNQISDAKIIAVDHNPRPLNGYPLKKKIVKRLKGILFSKYIEVFVGVSNYTVNEILKDFGFHLRKKTITIYNGVLLNDILVRENRNTSKPTFLVASHLRQSKGIQDLIEAVSKLPQEIKGTIKIDIYGDGPYKESLKQQVEALQVQHIFTFKGSKSNLKEIYCLYDYMLQPTHMECFSLSILESLAANVPVITTHVGGNEEAIKNNENGFIFEAKNSKQLTVLLEEVYLGNKKITANTRKLIENNFTIDKMVSNYLQILN